MIKFRCYRRGEDNTPVIRDVDIVRFAQQVLYDYDPFFLETPGWFNADRFIEYYLRASVEVQHIYTESRRDIIAGAAIFNQQRIKVFDKLSMNTADIIVQPNTVIIDEWTENKSPFGFRAFTMMHEAGHLMMHQDVFRRAEDCDNGYGAIAAREVTVDNAVLCKRSMISGFKTCLVTSEDFREHQANTFAGAMLMPPRTFIPFVQEQIYDQGYNSGIFTIFPRDTFKKTHTDFRKIKFTTARAFGVSPTAVEVQMKKYGLYTPVRDFSEARQRLRFYKNM